MNVKVASTFATAADRNDDPPANSLMASDLPLPARLAFDILGVGVNVAAGATGDLTVSSAFMDAYGPEPRTPPVRRLDVEVFRSSLPDSRNGLSVPIHRTKHPYWTFDGTILSERPRSVAWPGRKVVCTVREGSLEIMVAGDVKAAFASESVFHAIRSVALPPRAAGAMLHASAIVANGRAILFGGDVLAGKTTLMTEAVLRHHAIPLANDRVLLAPDQRGEVTVSSWPSYASYCEGTLLRYPELTRAALAYEQPDCPYRTQTWPAALERTYDKNRKRIYPMGWFADAANRRYAPRAPLGALVFPVLTLDGSPSCLRRLRSEEGAERLRNLVFLYPDPAFRPWHGIAPSEPPVAPAEVRDLLRQADVPIFELVVPAETLRGFPEALATIRSSW
jgi:hypothetical protein